MGKNFQSQCKLNVCSVYFLKPKTIKRQVLALQFHLAPVASCCVASRGFSELELGHELQCGGARRL